MVKLIYRTTLFFISFIVSSSIISNLYSAKASIVGDEEIIVQAEIVGCHLTLKAYPENRVPALNNWSTILDVEIINSVDNTSEGSFVTTTDNFGDSTVNLCDLNIFPLPGDYNFYLQGYSHLRKRFNNINTFNTLASNQDFTGPGNELIAGETSMVFDNVINSLDISTQINYMFGSDYKNDLNQDGVVNSLDLSNTINNFYVVGD